MSENQKGTIFTMLNVIIVVLNAIVNFFKPAEQIAMALIGGFWLDVIEDVYIVVSAVCAFLAAV